MPFTPVAAPQIELLQNAVDGDVFIPSFSRRSFLTGATAVLSTAPPLTMVGNLLTVDAPVRNYSLTPFAGLGLSIETTVVAGNFPTVATRDVQVKNVASTGHTYTYPTSRRLGQLMVMAVATAALTTITTPSGWTLVQSQAGTASRTSIFTRVVDGLEPSTELLAFGTASGAVVRTWMIDIGDGPVEAVAGINDSAAGTSLDLATISPTWAVSEATNTLYIAVLGLDNDVTVSGFPAGYTVTGQDASASGTANVDCALAYAERSALGSSENPGAFTYAAARSTGHVLAIKPKVTARMNWDGLAVRKAGVLAGTRRAINVIDGTNITTTVVDNAGTGAVDITINASGGSAHVLRDDGVDMTARAAANFLTSSSITAILTDDAVNGETEITFQTVAFSGDVTSAANSLALTIINNAVTNAKLADMAANTLKANPTAGSTDPTDFAVTSESVVGRTSGNITNIASAVQTALIRAAGSLFFASAAADQVLRRAGSGDLGFGTLVTGNIGNSQVTLAKIQNVADDTMLVNISGASGPLAERTLAQMAGDGIVYDATNHHWDVNGSTSIVVTGDQVTRAGLTGSITAAANSNDTRFAGLQLSGSTMPVRMFFDFLMSGGIDITPVDDSANDRLRFGFSRQALTGAISASSGGNATLFAGIRVNDGLTTDRQNLNFFQSTTIDPAATDDSANNEIELRFEVIANSIDNTHLADMPAASVKGRARGAGTGDPQNLSSAQLGSIIRFQTAETLNVTGVITGLNIDESTTVPRFSNGGNTGIILSISAPTVEGHLMFPEISTGGGDEAILVEDSAQAAGTQIRTPGGIPYRIGGSSSTSLNPMMYHSQANVWAISGVAGGDHASLIEIDEHFDYAVQTPVVLEGGSGHALFNFTSSNHSWAAVATAPGAGTTAALGTLDNELHHRGILQIGTSNQTNSTNAIYIAQDTTTSGSLSATETMYDSDQIWRYEAWVRIPSGQTTSFKVLVGFMSDASNTDGGADFIGFVGATNNGTSATNWVARCRATSVNTELNTAVAFSANIWHKLEWFRFDEFVLFYVNRVYVGNITTNVTNANGSIGVFIQSLTTAARIVHVDRIRMHLREAAYD